MKQKRTGLFALALASVMAISALVPAAFAADSSTDAVSGATPSESTDARGGKGRCGHRGGRQRNETTEEAGIGKDAAKTAALSDAGLTAKQVEKVRARYSTKDDTAAYRVFFVYEDTAYSYKIDAETGAVLDKKTGSAEELQSRGKHGKGGKEAAAEEAGIGRDAAKQAALSAAGLTADQVGKVKARYTTQDDVAVYKVSFRYDGQKYSFVINAETGAVMEHTTEAANV